MLQFEQSTLAVGHQGVKVVDAPQAVAACTTRHASQYMENLL